MPISTSPEWMPLALYALGGAIVLTLLFRIPRLGGVLRALFSLAILAFGIFVLLQQAPYDPNLSRLTASLGVDRQQIVGSEVRIPMSRDGHFWAQVEINGVSRRMLIDSGATVTALSSQTAEEANVPLENRLLPIVVRTANGTVEAKTGSIARLAVGGIVATDLKAIISPALGSVDVLGMNFLSQLQAWRVEGRMLIMTPAPGEAAS